MRKKTSAFLLFLLLLLVTVACSKDEQTAEPKEEQDVQEETQEPEVKEPEFKNVYPLTGIATNEPVDDRIVAVMVNNHFKARPQTGLTQADIVFEMLAEGDITRFMALFHSEQPEKIGPVRSARPYYFNLADDYGALYVHHGAAQFIEDMLINGAADYLNGMYYDNDGHLFERADFRQAPHNSYTIFDGIFEVAKEKGYDITGQYEPLPFLSEDEVIGLQGEAAKEASFSYFSNDPIRYVYDTASEKYFRYNGEQQSVELETEEPIQLDNVFLIEAHHEVVDDYGRRDIDLQSGGDAYLLQKGKLQKVQWENVDGRIVASQNGETIGFVPGKTWINVIPESPGLEGVTIQ
ncbi:DUF3048 domain-containing protein [Aquibacillus kalidii]|uniref:DUF3048 domain-containing protein n=1 Tax=Aquibacillus kalidii TaxID=2762597 RepID=UPI001647804F|nr:DUF3048 domain-containing protein [Aquibacillus kalidii]